MTDKFEQYTLALGQNQIAKLRQISSNKMASLDVQVRNALAVYCEIVEGDTLNRAWQKVKEANDRNEELQAQLARLKLELHQLKSSTPNAPLQ